MFKRWKEKREKKEQEKLMYRVCCLCGEKDKKDGMDRFLLDRVEYEYGIYGVYNVYKYFHQQCAKDIMYEPEKHGHKKVDLALWCMECSELIKREGVINEINNV